MLYYTDMLFVPQFGDSALMTAAKNCHTDAVVELVKAGAKLDLHNNVMRKCRRCTTQTCYLSHSLETQH